MEVDGRGLNGSGSAPLVAVLGCGYWGKNLVRNFNHLDALALVCDPVQAGRAIAEEVAPGVETASDLDAVLDRKEIAAVVIATPANTHHSLAIRAMRAGKDVFVEKPLALNRRHGMEMHRVAEETERVLMVGHLLEYHPAVVKLREWVADGALGNVNYIYSNRLNFGKIRTEENALWSFAPHDIAVILRLAGDLPVEVTCSGGSYITPNLADVTLSTLRFHSGLRAHIFVSWLNPFKEQQMVVVGDRRMAGFNDVVKKDKLTLYNQRVEVNGRVPSLHNGQAAPVTVSDEEPLAAECRHFLECVRERRAPLSGARSGIDVLTVLEACQLSMEADGRPVRVAEIERLSRRSAEAAAG